MPNLVITRKVCESCPITTTKDSKVMPTIYFHVIQGAQLHCRIEQVFDNKQVFTMENIFLLKMNKNLLCWKNNLSEINYLCFIMLPTSKARVGIMAVDVEISQP